MGSVEPRTLPILPWRTRFSLYLVSAVTDASRRPNGTLNRRFINILDIKSPPNETPANGVMSFDVKVDSTRNLWFRLFVPTRPQNDGVPLPVIIFFHGGGFTFLAPDSRIYDAVCRRFARKLPAVVISVNYRLAPEHRFPSQYEDGFDVLKFLDEHRDISALPKNVDLSRCFLAGDSAGGNIAHNVAFRACSAEFREVKVIGLIMIQPFFGGEERTESEIRLAGSPLVSIVRTDWQWRAFLPEGSDRNHEAANVCGPNSVDISGIDFPGTLVFIGGFDPLRDWQSRYYEWLKRSGKDATLVDYSTAVHAFYLFPELPEASLLFTEVKAFVEKKAQLI